MEKELTTQELRDIIWQEFDNSNTPYDIYDTDIYWDIIDEVIDNLGVEMMYNEDLIIKIRDLVKKVNDMYDDNEQYNSDYMSIAHEEMENNMGDV